MTDKKKFPYWLFVEESKTVKFSDLAHLIAKALHPSDAETYAYGAARVNLDEELPKAVADGTLRVRNPAGLGLHTFPIGEALQRAVMLPQLDLTQFLESRGIGLCLTPHGNGPIYWTLENAATAIQKQEDWHKGQRLSLLEKLEEASAQRCLVMLDPFDYLPVTTSEIRNYWELVTTTKINAWLDKQGAPYRLNVAVPAQTPAPEQANPAPTVEAETPKQRRARWLDWYGKGERGDLRQVYERELRTNPRADRSFIGKEIKKAKQEKKEAKQGGNMFSQLVQDGKRVN